MPDNDARKGWKVTAAGEMMVTRPFSMFSEPDFLAVKEKLEAADISYAHLEMNFIDEDHMPCASRGDYVASYMNAEPAIAKDLRWLGIDMLSTAHNHSCDFGCDGLMANLKNCREAGIVTAGTGACLDEAEAPAFFESPRGRVALISAASGNKGSDWADKPLGKVPARPGINPLRTHTRYHVTKDIADSIKKMCNDFGILTTNKSYNAHYLNDDEFVIGTPMANSRYTGVTFVEDEENRVEMYGDEKDIKRILRDIESAKKVSDLVMVAHHFNVSEGPRGDEPPEFARDFAHAAIDAGADIYFGHGWHRTLGIEIYKGKPIIYNVGNLFAQSQFLRNVPYDSFESWGHDMDKASVMLPTDEPLHPGIDKPSALWWNSAIYEMTFDDEKNLSEIKLTPLELGRDFSYDKVIVNRPTGTTADGRPMVAHGDNAKQILERFVKLSAKYGTEITIDGETAYWRA